MILLQQMIILFLMMMVGFVCRKRGIIGDNGSKTLSAIVVNVSNPAMVLSSGINNKSGISGSELALTFGLAVAMFAVYILLAGVVARLLRVDGKTTGVYKVMFVFSNIGFMGYPVVSAMYGSDALLYAAIFNIVYNILIYTYGIFVLRGEAAEAEPSLSGKRSFFSGFELKRILNIGVTACILTLFFYFTKISVPEPIESALDYLSAMTAPLSMIVIGDAMANMKLKDIFADMRLILFSAIKLLAVPAIGIGIAKLLPLSPELLGVFFVMLSTPVGSMTAMLAQQYDSGYDTASRGVALSTLLSVATMPLMHMLIM